MLLPAIEQTTTQPGLAFPGAKKPTKEEEADWTARYKTARTPSSWDGTEKPMGPSRLATELFTNGMRGSCWRSWAGSRRAAPRLRRNLLPDRVDEHVPY
jgi:hypothetical protein